MAPSTLGMSAPSSPVRLGTGKGLEAPTEFSYDKVIELFTASHSSMLSERHVAAVHRLCRVNASGFPIRDLVAVDKVLSLVLERLVEGDLAYADACCALLRTLGLPYVKRTATDEFKMLNNISQVLSTVSRGLGEGMPADVQIAAAEALAEFASAYGNRPSVFDYESTQDTAIMSGAPRQFHTNQTLLEKSGVVQATVQALGRAVAGADVGLKESIAFTVLQFSYKVENCYQLVEAGVLGPLASLLDAGMRDPVVVTACEAMWNVLELVPDSRLLVDGGVDAAAVRGKAASALTNLTKSFLTLGHRLSDKETRNELLVVADLLVGEEANRPAFVESGFLSLALEVATTPEMRAEGSVAKPFAMTKEVEDFEMKRLMLEVSSMLCSVPEGLEAALASGFMDAMLMYLDTSTDCAGVLRWTDAQLRDIREQVLSILYRVVPLCPDAFSAGGHHVVLLAFVRGCADEGLLEGALRVLRRVTPLPGYAALLGSSGAVSVALDLFAEPNNADVIREDAVALLSALCAGGAGPEEEGREGGGGGGEAGADSGNLREFRKLGGINALVDELESLKAADPTLLSPLVLGVVDAVWNCVVASRRNLARFLAQDGMAALLDLLEVCSASLYPVVLSCLADIFENPKSHVFFHEWRSRRDGKVAAKMVVEIWRQQEAQRGVVTRDGVLANTSRPLAGTGHRTKWAAEPQAAFTFQDPGKRSAQEQVEGAVGVDEMMAKVYSVVAGLGVDSLGYLDHSDAATVASIEQYVKFKQGEVWQDINSELEREGMKPTEPDRLRLTSGIQRGERLAADVAGEQASILHAAYDEATEQEAVFYNNISSMRAQEAEARKYKRNRAQLTMKERLEAKLKKEQMLGSSFKPKLKPAFLKERTEWLVEGEAADFV